MTRAELIRKIQGLFRLGDRARNQSEGEALAAIAAARRLMARYAIDESELGQTERGVTWEFGQGEAAASRRGFSAWEIDLGVVIAKMTNTRACSAVLPPIRGIIYAGAAADVEIAIALFKALHQSIQRSAYRTFAPERSIFDRARRKGRWSKQHNSYAIGFVFAIEDRLSQAVDLDKAAAAQFAIVIGNKREWLRNELATRFPDMCTAARPRPNFKDIDKKALTAGFDDGEKADIGFKKHLTGVEAREYQ